MPIFKIVFDTATLPDLAAIAGYRKEYLKYSFRRYEDLLAAAKECFSRKAGIIAVALPASRQEKLHHLGLRLCFGKNVAPYCAIFKVFLQTRQVLVYRIVHERSDYASLFQE